MKTYLLIKTVCVPRYDDINSNGGGALQLTERDIFIEKQKEEPADEKRRWILRGKQWGPFPRETPFTARCQIFFREVQKLSSTKLFKLLTFSMLMEGFVNWRRYIANHFEKVADCVEIESIPSQRCHQTRCRRVSQLGWSRHEKKVP